MSEKAMKLRRQFQEGRMTAREYFDEMSAEYPLFGMVEILEWIIDETERLVDMHCYFDTRHKIEGPLKELKLLQYEMVSHWVKEGVQ